MADEQNPFENTEESSGEAVAEATADEPQAPDESQPDSGGEAQAGG